MDGRQQLEERIAVLERGVSVRRGRGYGHPRRIIANGSRVPRFASRHDDAVCARENLDDTWQGPIDDVNRTLRAWIERKIAGGAK